MLRVLGVRLVTAVIGLSAGLALPSTALAHALQHARAEHQHNHERDHEHHGPAPHDHGPEASPGSSALTDPDADDHPHPRVEVAPTVRTDTWAAVAVVAVVATFVLSPDATAPPAVFIDRFPGPDLSTGPPPRLRAPPIR